MFRFEIDHIGDARMPRGLIFPHRRYFPYAMDELESLLPHYERELGLLSRDLLQFQREYPEAAARLSISGGQTDDPHVERLLQAAALLNARVARRIDDSHPQFTETYIESVFPAYLRRIPSCSVAQFDAADMVDGSIQTVLISQGTALEHQPSLCQFRTAWDVALAPISIPRARFLPSNAAPPPSAAQVPSGTAGIVSVDFALPEHTLTVDGDLMPQTLRVYLHADRLLAAALVDAILLRPQTAFVEADGSRCWQALEKPPARALGFTEAEGVIEEPRHAKEPALRLLIEYAAFPQKFRFLEFDFAALLRAAGPCRRLTLHIPVAASALSAASIQRLAQLDADHLRLFCTPVVNLFQIDAKPVDARESMQVYPVVLPNRDGAAVVIHTIDCVRIVRGAEADDLGTEIPPHGCRYHGSPVGMCWLWERDPLRGGYDPMGGDMAIRLVGLEGSPVASGASRLGIKLTCSNGNVPTTIDTAGPGNGLHSEALNLDKPATMLVAPSASSQPPREDSALWRLISALSPNYLALSPSSLALHHDLLFQLAESGSPEAARYITGITGLSARPITRFMHVKTDPMPSFVRGIQVTLVIDESAFAGHSRYTFAQLMEGYFLRYADRICLELIVNSHDGGEIYHGEPRFGLPG